LSAARNNLALVLFVGLFTWLTPPAFAQEGTVTRPASKPAVIPGGIYHQALTDQIAPSRLFSARTLRQWARDVANALQPDDGGAILAGLVVLLIVACRFTPFRFLWNLDVLLLLVVAVLFADLVPRQHRLDRPGERESFTLAFTLIYAATAWWALRGLIGSRMTRPPRFNPVVPTGLLAVLAIVLVLWNMLIVLVRPPDDCGVYTNLGTQRMLESKTLPYGDAALRSGAAATYGPVLYLAHAPVHLAAGTHARNAPNASLDPAAGYENPPLWITKAVCAAFHAIGLVALFLIGRQLMGSHVGWALVCLYAGSAYVLGVGGGETRIGGMGYISHIAPAGLTVAAFLALSRPVLSGALLALAAGTVYYPAFFFPAWWAWHKSRRQALRFTIGFAATGLLLAGVVIAFTHTEPGENAVKLFFESTLEHQEAAGQYGSSPFSFFGVHPALRASWASPLFGDSSLLKPTFLGVAALSLLGFVLGRGRTVPQLAMLTASLAAAVQLWKTHATGSYVEWYYPFLLIGMFCEDRRTEPALHVEPESG
jgi:hypothetical protein